MPGVGATEDAVPPVALVPYQFRVPPVVAVADKGLAVWFWQYGATVAVAGAPGFGLTSTGIALRGLSHPFTVCVT